MPSYERLDTIDGRIECVLRSIEERAPIDAHKVLVALDSSQAWVRRNADGAIRAYLRGLGSLVRASLRNRMTAAQDARFERLVLTEAALIKELSSRGYANPIDHKRQGTHPPSRSDR
jgi:hypothetical protein